MNRLAFDITSDRRVAREHTGELCRVVATANFCHPVALHFGGAIVTLTKRDALAMARALTDAVLSLPKGL